MEDLVLKAQRKMKFFHEATTPDLVSPWRVYLSSFTQCPGQTLLINPRTLNPGQPSKYPRQSLSMQSELPLELEP